MIFEFAMAFVIIGLGTTMSLITIGIEPVLYNQLNFHQKICKHFSDCNGYEQKWDESEAPLIVFFMVLIPIISVFLVFMGMLLLRFNMYELLESRRWNKR